MASAVERICNQESSEDLALELMNKRKYHEKAIDFISDLKEIGLPNTAPKRVMQSNLKKHEIPDKVCVYYILSNPFQSV